MIPPEEIGTGGNIFEKSFHKCFPSISCGEMLKNNTLNMFLELVIPL